jgi:TPR repeat protein
MIDNVSELISNKVRSALSGDINASFWLGSFYSSHPQYRDVLKARHYLTIAAESGHVEAMNLLGYLYHHEQAFQDIKATVYWYERALEKGHREAAYNLALLYHRGHQRVTEQDAISCFELEPNGAKANHYYSYAADSSSSGEGDIPIPQAYLALSILMDN